MTGHCAAVDFDLNDTQKRRVEDEQERRRREPFGKLKNWKKVEDEEEEEEEKAEEKKGKGRD